MNIHNHSTHENNEEPNNNISNSLSAIVAMSHFCDCYHIIQWQSIQNFGHCEISRLDPVDQEFLYRLCRKAVCFEYLRKMAYSS